MNIKLFFKRKARTLKRWVSRKSRVVLPTVFLLACLVGGVLLIGGLIFEREEALAELRETQTRMAAMEEDLKELAHLRSIYALAVEFDLSPIVVEAFYREAVAAIEESANDWKTWRFVRTPEFLTYLMCSIIRVESGGDRWAVGDGGQAIGLTQIWLTTAKDYEAEITRDQLFDPMVQARVATRHFVRLLERHDGNHARAIISWNRGEGRVDQLLLQNSSPENGYVYKVYHAALARNSTLREQVLP